MQNRALGDVDGDATMFGSPPRMEMMSQTIRLTADATAVPAALGLQQPIGPIATTQGYFQLVPPMPRYQGSQELAE